MCSRATDHNTLGAIAGCAYSKLSDWCTSELKGGGGGGGGVPGLVPLNYLAEPPGRLLAVG